MYNPLDLRYTIGLSYDISIDVNNENILEETAMIIPISICLIANIFDSDPV